MYEYEIGNREACFVGLCHSTLQSGTLFQMTKVSDKRTYQLSVKWDLYFYKLYIKQ